MLVDIDDLNRSEVDLVGRYGDAGEIMAWLIKAEGQAIWIPKFVNWLFEKYNITPKEKQ